MILPFEQDALPLLEACAMALLPLNAATQREAQASDTSASPQGTHRAVWQRSPGGSAVVREAFVSSADLTQGDNSFLSLLPQDTILNAEALSKAIERDARRYD